jgi:uncharacterized membrane protein affecting hemolysin expression
MNNNQITPDLKRKITERWKVLSDHHNYNPFNSSRVNIAFAQLEYILLEAGLLAPRRARQKQTPPKEEILT